MDDVFERCIVVNNYINLKKNNKAKKELFTLLDDMKRNDETYTPLVNHLIRLTGLFPYIKTDTAIFEDRLVYDIFKVNTGDGKETTLHIEQSNVLKKLLNGENLAISAPTSFGKSFIIDSFISIKEPNNVLIIVPTIALSDEIRRRLYKKFSDKYKIITTSDVEFSEKNIFIFPQERAIRYIDKINELDLLVVDEFYKASLNFDKERFSILQKTILKYNKIAKQKYFLAPNIKKIEDNLFTKEMEFITIDFNTVYLKVHEDYKTINSKDKKTQKDRDDSRNEIFINRINEKRNEKTLIYAGGPTQINKVAELFENNIDNRNIKILEQFSSWLEKNYTDNWHLPKVIRLGMGIHTGQLHRSLSQIQIHMFEDTEGFNNLVSTSSIIEGVNTSAQNVIVWSNKIGTSKFDSFTYKNIIGRGGRMFKHFVGHIYLFHKPPDETETPLKLDLDENNINNYDEYTDEFTQEQKDKITIHKNKMYQILGEEVYNQLIKENELQSSREIIEKIAFDMFVNSSSWNGLAYLNGDYQNWKGPLSRIIKFQNWGYKTPLSTVVLFIQVLSFNWTQSIPALLKALSRSKIDIDLFFKFERDVTFKLSGLLNDINILQNYIFNDKKVDISSFTSQVSHAFLPSVVFQLEEYGLPRMLSKKIHAAKIINFEEKQLTIHSAIEKFHELKIDFLEKNVPQFDEFDLYILKYFYDGISKNK